MSTDYEPNTFPLRARGVIARPEKGSAKMARKLTRAEIVKQEEKHKAAAKKRDGHRCRLPFCPWCAAFRDQLLHGAHVIEAKGAGGDPLLTVSQPEHLMALCALAHVHQEKHEFVVEPLTTALTNRVCAFYLLQDVYDGATGAYHSERVLWAQEKAIGVPETSGPCCVWDPISRLKEID